MNFPRLAVAAASAWIAFVAIGSVVHGVLLADLYVEQARGVRGEGETHPALGFGLALVGFFAFAYAYAKGYEGGRGTQEGMRFGVLVALMLVSFAAVWGYIVFPISAGLAAALAIDYVVEFAIYGMIVGAVYRPAPAVAARGASAALRR
jgi:hypothetical protein